MRTDRASFEEFYKSIGKTYSPYFKDYIYFTDVGFKHIRFKNEQLMRPSKDIEMRIRLLPIVIKIIGASHTVQNKTIRKRLEHRYVNSRKELAMIDVTYYEFIAIIDDWRVRVVIKQVNNAEMIFLSVIPAFKQKMPLEESDIL